MLRMARIHWWLKATAFYSMKYWTIDIHVCDCENMSYNNENRRAIICIDKFGIVAHSKSFEIARRFCTTHAVPLSLQQNTGAVAKHNAKPSSYMVAMTRI